MNEQARWAVASYTTYQETGRMAPGRAVRRGAASGALPGALTGWTFGLLDRPDPVGSALLLALYGLVFGALVGALSGLLMHTARRGRRDFASVSSMRPGRYDVVADDAVADEAVRLPAALPSGTGAGARSGAWKSGRPRSGPAVT
ncbi:general stress protein [Streptomyces spinosirectus]